MSEVFGQPSPLPQGKCMDCGMPSAHFPMDVVVPDDQWAQITGRTDGTGLLCVACILRRASKLPGIRVAKLTFGVTYESRRARRARVREEAKAAQRGSRIQE
jgi:hypothetical protein